MSAATINLILAVIGELPAITETAIELLALLRGEELSPEQIQRLEELEKRAREEWDKVVEEDRPGNGEQA